MFEYTGRSALVQNMQTEIEETFPVLIGDEVAHFHSITGGYNKDENFTVVNLVHHVQEIGSPYRVNVEQLSHNVETHLANNYYNLDVDSIRVQDDYPEKDYIVSLKVMGYKKGKFPFSEELSAPVDSRETRYEK